MKTQIIISKEVAKLVAGRWGKYSEIIPTELKDGTFCIPVNILKDKDLAEMQKLIQPFLNAEKLVEKVDESEKLQKGWTDIKEVQSGK
jgi:hypothetical protein